MRKIIFSCLFILFSFNIVSASYATNISKSFKQKVNISYKNGDYKKKGYASFNIPYIGSGQIACTPHKTHIRMIPSNTRAENNMWSVLYQDKGGIETAVKNARVYTFPNPNSTLAKGTGKTAQEGFNTIKGIENQSSGNMIGLFSKKNSRNAFIGNHIPPTSFKLEWSWKNFNYKNSECNLKAEFITELNSPHVLGSSSSFSTQWHKTQSPVINTTNINNIGNIEIQCENKRYSQAYLKFKPDNFKGYLKAITYQAQGKSNTETQDYYTLPDSTDFPLISLPINGFTVIEIYENINSKDALGYLFITSEVKSNDLDNNKNYCEAIGQYVKNN